MSALREKNDACVFVRDTVWGNKVYSLDMKTVIYRSRDECTPPRRRRWNACGVYKRTHNNIHTIFRLFNCVSNENYTDTYISSGPTTNTGHPFTFYQII